MARIINLSRLPDRSVLQAVDFVEQNVPAIDFDDVLIHLHNGSVGKDHYLGLAAEATLWDSGFVSIGVWVMDSDYPYMHKYRERAGPIVLNNVYEELVHTVAHEYGHVQQYKKVNGFGHHRFYEVEAELFAHSIVTKLRDVPPTLENVA